MKPSRHRRIPRSFLKRGLYSLGIILVVVFVGTLGMHLIEGMSYLDAFYFTSMIATGQGPNYTPVTDGGKVFTAILAFVSVGLVITALVFLFGPLFGTLLKMGWEKFEEEAEHEMRGR